MICLSSRGESYDRVDVFSCRELPSYFSWLSTEELSQKSLFVFRALTEYGDLSFLPVINGERLGYLVCESMAFENE